MSELKPCPFCGGEASVRASGASGKYWIACKACLAKTGQCDTMQTAAKAWNRRAQPTNKEKGKYAMDTESKRIFDDLYALHDHYDEDPQHMICAEAADYIKSLSEMLNRRAQPANKPLTLDQLREMDGEPVWITFFGDEENTPQNRWGILGKSVTGTFGIWEDGLVLKEVDYGKTWLAYRHKPEGSENDG